MDIVIVSDSAAVRARVRDAIPDPAASVRELTRGLAVVPAVREKTPDLAVIDLQIGKMGGMAVCQELHLEHGAGRLPHVPVLMLLDRRADVFLARRSNADGWVIKPFDPVRLARAVKAVLGGERFADETYAPVTVAARRPVESGAAAEPGR